MSEQHDSRRKYHLACLAELADMGLDIARIVARQAKENPDRAVELTRVVDRLTREVLKTTKLHREIAEEVREARVASLQAAGYVAPPTSGLVH